MSRRALARLGVTLAALGLVVWALGAAEIGAALRGVAPGWAALAVAALMGQIIASALRWRLTAGALGLPVTPRAAVGEYFLSVLGNTLLPGGVLGDVGRAARIRHRAGLEAAAHSVVIERLTGQVVLGLAAVAGLVAWLWPAPAAWGVLGGLALGALVAAAALRGVTGAQAGLMRRFLAALRRVWMDRHGWRAQAGLSLVILACNLAGFWAAAAAVGILLPPGAALVVLPLTLMAMLLPVSVNGWGLREATAAALWPLAGAGAASAVAASIIYGIAALLAALPGLWPLLRPAPA